MSCCSIFKELPLCIRTALLLYHQAMPLSILFRFFITKFFRVRLLTACIVYRPGADMSTTFSPFFDFRYFGSKFPYTPRMKFDQLSQTLISLRSRRQDRHSRSCRRIFQTCLFLHRIFIRSVKSERAEVYLKICRLGLSGSDENLFHASELSERARH